MGNTTLSQQTQNIFITFIQRRSNVLDVGPALYKCYTNVLFLLGVQWVMSDSLLIRAKYDDYLTSRVCYLVNHSRFIHWINSREIILDELIVLRIFFFTGSDCGLSCIFTVPICFVGHVNKDDEKNQLLKITI